MSRRKKPDENESNDQPSPTREQQAVAVADRPPPEANGHHANGEVKRRPAASFAAMTDRTTRIEVAVWGNVVKTQSGEYTQYSLTITRSWKDAQNQWHQGGSFRVHDTPVLMFLVNKAYEFALTARTEVKTDDVPF